MMQRIKIVVTGVFNAGKTRFIATASEIEPVSTERRVTDASRTIKPLTTAALDFGRRTLDNDITLHLYGTPGQRRFDFMWAALARGMRGLLVMVDSSRAESFAESRRLLDYFLTFPPVPTLVVANKQDQPGAIAPAALHRALHLPPEIGVVACSALDSAQVQRVFDTLLPRIVLTELPEQTGESHLVPIRPHPPARVAALALRGSQGKRHLTQGDERTLCGRAVPAAALPALLFQEQDCQICAARARALGLTCEGCNRPLTRSTVEGLCLGCARQRITSVRDQQLFEMPDLAKPGP